MPSASIPTSTSFSHVIFPSAAFPEAPSFTIDGPDGWDPVVTPDALVVLRHTEHRPFQSNLVVTCERFPSSTTVTMLAADVDADRASRLVNYGSSDIESLDHEAGDAALFRSAFTIAVNGVGFDVAQWTAFIDSETFGDVHYITAITATAARAEAADLDAHMLAAIRSLRYG
jgi:hypothetical protein